MKSRTSSSNLTLLRKDIFRFAPLWGIYLIGGLLVMLSYLSSGGIDDSTVDLAETMAPFAVVNMIYAGLVALMLFGDLYNTRMCYALHAMPMRRETWFLTHVISGFLYSFVPHLIAALLFMPLLGEYWFLSWAWLLSMTLQYLFFFGLAVLAALLCGNRFAALAVYAILNFVSLIVYWFVETLYAPFLYGIVIPDKPFFLFCPVVQMVENSELLLMESEWISYSKWSITYNGFGSGWGYLAICAGVGIVLLGVALLLYRRRKLESAGDFIAVKPLEPIFAVVLTLCAGCTFTMFGSVFGTGGNLAFFVTGLIVGWFGGQMLLQRTVKVFKGKAFLKLGVLILVLALSLGLTAWDPLGITTYVPDTKQVQRVELARGSLQYIFYQDEKLDTQDPQLIARVCDLHRQMQKDHKVSRSEGNFTLRYTLKNGRQVVRSYYIRRDTESWDIVRALLSGPEPVLGVADKTGWDNLKIELQINGWELDALYTVYRNKLGSNAQDYDLQEMAQSLKEALWNDCVAGTLVSQDLVEEKDYADVWVHGVVQKEDGSVRYYSWSITDDMEHCIQWLQKYADLLQYAT